MIFVLDQAVDKQTVISNRQANGWNERLQGWNLCEPRTLLHQERQFQSYTLGSLYFQYCRDSLNNDLFCLHGMCVSEEINFVH